MSRVIATALAVVVALVFAVHVGAPAIGAPAPLPVLLVFAWVIAALAYLITVTIKRDGWFPVWVRAAAT